MAVVLAASFRADPWRATANLVLTVSAMLTNVIVAIGLKRVTNAVIAHNLHEVIVGAWWIGGSAAIGLFAGVSQFNLSLALRENVSAYLDRRLMSLASSVPTLEHHERSDYLDEIELLRTNHDALGGAME